LWCLWLSCGCARGSLGVLALGIPLDDRLRIALRRSAGQNAFFAYRSGTFADGERYRVVPQMYYYWGRFGLLAEYALSAQEVRRGAASTQLENTAWQVEASVLLTDDVASYRGVSPKRPFDPTKGNWGALEIAGRYNELDVDDAAFLGGFADPVTSATQARGWAVGLNWYLNRNVRTFVTYEETEFDGGAAAGTDRPTEKIVFTRLQLAY
jgi:phosphate-selective porin OprO/OprP